MQRRSFLTRATLLGPGASTAGLLAALAGDAAAQADPRIARLREGACAVLMRHALTDPGVGDPPGFRPGVCSTQRNLSEDGRLQARKLGAAYAAQRLVPAQVRSSAWCRCIDTARLAFGRAELWAPLDSSFEARGGGDERHREIARALAAIAPGRFEVWVTHQVNISALTGASTAMGGAVLVVADASAPTGVRSLGAVPLGG